MKPKGLPPLDLPFHLKEPNSCAGCKHSYYRADDARHLRCLLTRGTLCVRERDLFGNCGEDPKHWKDRRDV